MKFSKSIKHTISQNILDILKQVSVEAKLKMDTYTLWTKQNDTNHEILVKLFETMIVHEMMIPVN